MACTTTLSLHTGLLHIPHGSRVMLGLLASLVYVANAEAD